MSIAIESTDTSRDTSAEQLDRLLDAATAAAPVLAASGLDERAGWIRAAADALDAAVDDLVPLAIEESHLPEPRLRGEVARSSGQLRMFANALADGSLLEVVIDTADPQATPVPRPDLRRVLVPLGPVLVFAASNFPFAFSVCGGDTASALAAGCPVVVKVHPGHPRTSQATAEVMVAALREAGAPDGTLALVTGQDAGVRALRDPRVRASGFTGSVPAGRALHEIAVSRPEPIPFYGELGSLNPVVVTPGAVRARGQAVAEGYVGSFTLGVGQFCTKPGLLLLPRGHGLEEHLVRAAREVAPATMLNDRIGSGFAGGLDSLRTAAGVETLVEGAGGEQTGASLVRTTVEHLLAHPEALLAECFGPVSVVVEYADEDDLARALDVLEGTLTATVHAEDDEVEGLQTVLATLVERAGRIVWNGWPTGVAVSWAMHHGGPFPATIGSVHTSVGVTAARRFQRPVCFQDTPAGLLPEVLRDRNTLGVARRIDGEVTRGDVPA
jgi:NADP-dependent aldehyde dehydrogenase